MANKLSGRTGVVLAFVTVIVLLAGFAFVIGPSRRREQATREARPRTLVATIRTDPSSFNRLIARDRSSHLVSVLLHARLVRINLATQDLEPALAERWSVSPDGREYRLELRRDTRFSDGMVLTSDDVVFSFAALYDEKVASPLAAAVRVNGRPLEVSAPDAHTVVIRFPAPYGPGLRILDVVPILPRRRLKGALREGTLRDAWSLTTTPSEICGLGPFVLEEYRAGERLVFARNPHYWRKGPGGDRLPYIDRIVLAIVPDQSAEILRLEAGQADVMAADVRPADLAAVREAAESGRLRVHDLGVSLDPDFLWFNLTPRFRSAHPDRAWIQRDELRKAISAGVDRAAFARLVYGGAAVPVSGPVTSGNRIWFDPGLPVPSYDPARARQLLAAIGLRDADGDGTLDASRGQPAAFSLLTQKGNSVRERAAQFLQEEVRRIGLRMDVVALEQPAVLDRIAKGDFDAVYLGVQQSNTDPAANLDFWLSSGVFHPWNPGQPTAATDWEGRIDELMQRQVATTDLAERRRLFNQVQEIFIEHEPAIYFVAPRVRVATSARVGNVVPALLQPPVMWNADSLTVDQR